MDDTLTDVAGTVRRLKQILVQDLQLNMAADAIPDDYSLLEDGLALDSILIEEFIAQIENRFGLRFDDRVLDAQLFGNLTALGTFVAQEHAAAQSKAEALPIVAPS